jgi:hypothetical protein
MARPGKQRSGCALAATSNAHSAKRTGGNQGKAGWFFNTLRRNLERKGIKSVSAIMPSKFFWRDGRGYNGAVKPTLFRDEWSYPLTRGIVRPFTYRIKGREGIWYGSALHSTMQKTRLRKNVAIKRLDSTLRICLTRKPHLFSSSLAVQQVNDRIDPVRFCRKQIGTLAILEQFRQNIAGH